MGNLRVRFCCEDTATRNQEGLPSLQQPPSLLSGSRNTNRDGNAWFELQEAAKEFCEKGQISQFYVPPICHIMKYGHQGEFQERWHKLSEGERSKFLERLNSIKIDLMEDLYQYFLKDKERILELRRRQANMYGPSVIVYDGKGSTDQQFMNKGTQLIRQGKVALVLMCGGSSSRFGPSNKFLTKFSQKKLTLLDFLFASIKQRITQIKGVLIILHCSEDNLGEVQNYLLDQEHYGLGCQNFLFTCSSPFVILDENKKYGLDDEFQLINRSPGTAQAAELLLSEHTLRRLKERAIQYIYFSGAENVFQRPLDAYLTGRLALQNKQMAAKCIENPGADYFCFPRYCGDLDSDKKVHLLSSEQMSHIADKRIAKLPIAMNSFVIRFDKMVRIIESQQKVLSSPEVYSLIKKEEQTYDYVNGKLETSQCYTFQRDILRYISMVEDPLLVEVVGPQLFMPVVTHSQELSFQKVEQCFKAHPQQI